MSSCVVVKEEVTGEMEEEDEEELKRRRQKERRSLYKRERRKRILKICAVEDVPGVGEEERRRIIEKEEKQKEMKRLRNKKRRAEERRAYSVEYYQRKRSEETAEEREDRLARQRINKWAKKVQMTDEEKEEKRRQDYFVRQARLAMMSEEEREEEARRKSEKHREWLKNLSEEKRRKHNEGLKRSRKRWQQKMKEKDPEDLKKGMQKYKSQWLQGFRDLGSFKNRISNKTRKHYEGMSEEEKMRRLNQMKMYQRKRNLRRKLAGTMDDEEIEKRLAELDKRLSEELGIELPRLSGLFGQKGSDCGAANSDAGCLTQVSTGPGDKEEVGQRSDHFSIDLSATTFYADSQVDPVEQAESYLCDFDEDDGASMLSPPEATHLNNNNPSSHSPPQQLQPVTLSNAQEIVGLILSCEYCECSVFLTENILKSHIQENHLKICWKCPSCKEVLFADPPGPMGWFGKKGTDCGDVNVGASSSEESCTGNVGKEEVGQWSDHHFVKNPATCYPDPQAEQEEPAAESYNCDFDEGEGASMPSPPESIQLNTPSPQSPQQQLEPVAPSTVPETAEMTFSCDYCECSPFLTENDLKSHLHENHLKICWKCPSCKEVMISAKHLSEHFNAVHKKPSISSTVDTQTTVVL